MLLDKVILPEMQFTACHGVYAVEKRTLQSFTVSVVMGVDLRQAGRTDGMAYTVDYSTVYQEIRDIMMGEPVDLIERLAELIAGAVLRHPKVENVMVRVRKDAADMGNAKVPAMVEIYRGQARQEMWSWNGHF